MKTKIKFFLILILIAGLAGCGKKSDNKVEEKVSEQTQKQTEEVNKQTQKEDSIKSAADKEAKVKEALEEENIVNDTAGQWATDAEASTTYASDKSDKNAGWSPYKMTGKPDVDNYGDNGNAWAPQEADHGVEWVKLTFAKEVNATAVKVRQSIGPGAIIKVDLIDNKGKSHTVWEGVDKTQYEPDKIKYFVATFDKTPYKTKTVKITLATNSVPGWNEIDAVQLIGE